MCNGKNSITSDKETGKVYKCKGCDGSGFNEFTECPAVLITRDIADVIKYSRLFEKGLPPMAGGVLDQTYNFLEAANFVLNEIAIQEDRLTK